MIWFAYAMAWISTAAAAIAGMYFTRSAWCLWALLLPACIKMTTGKESEGREDDI